MWLMPTQADNYQSVECKYWSALLWWPQSVISLHINLYWNVSAFAGFNIISVLTSQLVL